MILEDDDSFVQQEGLVPEEDSSEQRGRGIVIWLIIFLVWILWTAGCFFFFRDDMVRAFQESGVPELISSMQEEEEHSTHRDVTLVYPLADGTSVTVQASALRYGGDSFHDTVEALIEYYPYEALSQGAVNLVPSQTELIGLSTSDGICYVNLSEEILSAPSLGSYTAFDQIEDTLMLSPEIEKVVFLVEGTAVS